MVTYGTVEEKRKMLGWLKPNGIRRKSVMGNQAIHEQTGFQSSESGKSIDPPLELYNRFKYYIINKKNKPPLEISLLYGRTAL